MLLTEFLLVAGLTLALVGSLVTPGLSLGSVLLLTGLASVEGGAELDLSLELRALLLHAELVAGVLDYERVAKVSRLVLAILDFGQGEGLLGGGSDLGIALDSHSNLLNDFSAKDNHVINVVSTDKVTDFNFALGKRQK